MTNPDVPPASWRGRSVPRVEDHRILAATARYVDDLSSGRVLHAAFLRSPYAHAWIRAIDTTVAQKLAGVELVLTAADLTEVAPLSSLGPQDFFAPSFLPLTADKARFVGDPIALVVAGSRAVAEDAIMAIDVDYDALTAMVTIDSATAPDAPAVWDDHGSNVVWQRHWDFGVAERDPNLRRRGARFTSPSQTNVPLEGRGLLVDYEPSTGQMTVHAGTQAPGRLRTAIAHHLGLAEERIRVVVPDVGGSFGQKGWYRPEDIAVAAATLRLGAAVKWIEDRTESLLTGGKARDEIVDAEIGYDGDGIIRELDISLRLNQGAYPLPVSRATLIGQIRTLFPSAYRIGRYTFDATVVATNTPTYVPYRGPWSVETWVRERLIDMVAEDLDLDPVDVRRRNLVASADDSSMLTGPPLRDIQLVPALDRLTELIDLPAVRERQAAGGPCSAIGVGIACYIEPAPGPPEFLHAVTGLTASRVHTVQVRLDPTGTLVVWIGQAPHGQGHQTTFAQIAADEFGIELDRVRIIAGDTALPPFEMYATGGSSAAHLVGGAVRGATNELRRRVIERAAEMLEAAPHDIELRDGTCFVTGSPQIQIPVGEIAKVPPTGRGVGNPANGLEVSFRFENQSCGWSQGVHAAVVEVDLTTGLVTFERYVVVEACGPAINPAIVAGQIRGGVAQGIGSVLYESCAYDESGNPLTATLMDYLLPTSAEVPAIEIHHLDSSEPAEPGGYRGVGEGGTIGATAATLNAIANALSSRGANVTERYLPPYRILELARVIPAEDK